jgi:hypothetical protein
VAKLHDVGARDFGDRPLPQLGQDVLVEVALIGLNAR